MREYLQVAINAAEAAAQLLLTKDITKKINNSVGKDIKLQADELSEDTILKVLQSQSNLDILSEERGFIKGTAQNNLKWIIDPIDGSMNFLKGIPFYCVSIGLWKDNEPLLGVIYDLPGNNLYTGIVNEGCWCNQIPIQVSNTHLKSQAVLCTGFPVYTSFEENDLMDFIADIRSYKKIRLLGSAAMSLAMVAQGSADIYMENNIAIWDIAAGAALVKAAGGKCEITNSDREQYVLCKATNGYLE